MNDFINALISYFREARFSSIVFWMFPFFTILGIWILTVVGLKIFRKREKLKTVFIANRAWLVSSVIISTVLISLISIWWSQNYFAEHLWRFSLLVSLIISLIVPIITLINLRSFYTQEKIKEITNQPKTVYQLDFTIVLTKNAFNKCKFYLLIPFLGFIFLTLYFYKGSNLISVVFDNSGSMTNTTAIQALSETFDNLEENNKIILSTLDGPNYIPKSNAKTSISELMNTTQSTQLFAGDIKYFQNPSEAKSELLQITGFDCCSPICESIWKTYLYAKENLSNEVFKNKVLVIITDGEDNYISESIVGGQFFFDDENFTEFFPVKNVFVIDYSNGIMNPVLRKFSNAGCDIYAAENNKQAYLDALDNALQTFKNNWYLIYWTVLIFLLLTIIALLVPPKKII